MARTLWMLLLAVACVRVSLGEEESMPIATLPIQFKHNRAHISGVIKEQALTFMLDTGCGVTSLHPELIDELMLMAGRRLKMVGIAGEEWADTFRGVSIRFGEMDFKPRYVVSVPSERNESRRRRDGVLGEGFFKNYVVEIDSREKKLRLYAPTNYVYSGNGEVIPLMFKSETPSVEAAVVLPNREPITREFEIDTGCDSGLCLGADFVKGEKLLEALETRSSAKFGIGGSVETHDGSIPVLRLGKIDVTKPQTDFFKDGSPVDAPAVGHIGMGVWHRYKTIFDYTRKRMILERYEAPEGGGVTAGK